MKLSKALEWGIEYLNKHGIEGAREEAEYLLLELLNCSKSSIYLNRDTPLSSDVFFSFSCFIGERARCVPRQYITGKAWFASLPFMVNKDVMVPRPETEILIEAVIKRSQEGSALRKRTSPCKGSHQNNIDYLPEAILEQALERRVKHSQSATQAMSDAVPSQNRPGPLGTPNGQDYSDTTPNPLKIADIGTGCGNIAISLAKSIFSQVYAFDISCRAIDIAKKNAEKFLVAGQIAFTCEDILNSDFELPRDLDFVISNPPYIPHDDIKELPMEVRESEPHIALDGGKDGVEFYLPIIHLASEALSNGGYLALEVGIGQADRVREIIFENGSYQCIETINDYQGIERVIVACKK